MQTIQNSIITEALYAAQMCEEDATVTNEYSGRGMYGERCFGLDFTSRTAEDEFFEAIREQDVALYKALRSARTYDSMGLGSIVYFPGFQIDEWKEDEDDWDDEGEEG